MATKRPAFPLYAETWLSDADVTVMGPVARAVYLDLLLRCWNDGGIPEPDGTAAGWARLAALGRAESAAQAKKAWQIVQHKFRKTDDGRLTNDKLEAVRADLDAHAKRRSDAASTAAQARWLPHVRRTESG